MAPAAPRESDPPGHVAISNWFAAVVGALGLSIMAARLAIYLQIAQFSERLDSQRVQFAWNSTGLLVAAKPPSSSKTCSVAAPRHRRAAPAAAGRRPT
jgi:hypothetical protein